MRKLLFAACLLLLSRSHLSAQSSLDYKILEEWNIENHPPGLVSTFRFFSNGNSFFIVGAPVALLSAGYFNGDRQMILAGKNAAVSLGVSTVITLVMKNAIKRERPFERYQQVVKLSSGGGSSFPSGHTSSAFAVATSLSMSYPKWYVIAPSFAWASAVGVSRIALGVHYPSDVLAGAIVGAGSAWLTVRANHWLHRDQYRHRAAATGL